MSCTKILNKEILEKVNINENILTDIILKLNELKNSNLYVSILVKIKKLNITHYVILKENKYDVRLNNEFYDPKELLSILKKI